MRTTYHEMRGRTQRGFTLIEALIAMLVMAFGMLAIAGLQVTLSRSSDLAKQRSEAVRLAQLKMEELRSFDGVTAGSGVYTYTTNLVSNPVGTPEVISAGTNAVFTRTWAVTRNDGATPAAASDLEKWINVRVAWTDRTGQAQEVTLNSVIARNDPAALKGLIANQARKKIRYPKGRDINIPYPAVSLSGGKTSAFVPPPSNVAYVFDNVTGNIVQSCTAPAITITAWQGAGTTATITAPGHTLKAGQKVTIAGVSNGAFNGTFTVVTPIVAGTSFTYTLASSVTATGTGGTATLVIQLEEDMDIAAAGLTCQAENAYLLSGYIRFVSGAPSASGIENTTDATLDLLQSGPLLIDSSGTGKGPSSYACHAQRQKVVSASNLDPEDIASITRTGGIVTVVTKKSHSFAVGMRIGVEFVTTPAFNNSFIVAEVVPASKIIRYAQAGPDATVSNVGRVSLIQEIVIPEGTSVSGYNGLESRFVAYSCVVTPIVVDASKPKEWWGEVKLVPTGWTLGSASSQYGVCRYSGDYIVDGKVSNHEHPRYYRQVTGALDNQNFLVIEGHRDCPGDVVPAPLTGNYINTNTVRHQGGSGSPELSYQCLSISTPCGSKSPDLEPALPTVVPMF